LTAVASTLAFRTGVFNIGVESQVVIGGIVGTYAGFAFNLPAILHIPVCFLAAFVAGALWAAIPALMRQKLGISEIITTIMTNYIGTFLNSYLLQYVLAVSKRLTETPFIKDSAKLPQFIELMPSLGAGNRAHVGIFFALAISAILYVILQRTKIGFEWRMVGLSVPFAEFVGVNTGRTFIGGFLASGGIAGLAGLLEGLGVWRRWRSGITLGFGFKGNLAALLGGRTIIGSTLSGIFYGAMEAGALGVEWSAGVPRQLIDIIVGLIIFFMAAPGLWDILKRIKWVSAPSLVERTTEELEA
jgi:simple sugar transport system permease protein